LNRVVERRQLLLAAAAIVAVALGVVIFAAHDAKHRILQALGPRTTIGSISLNYPTVTLHDVHVAASDVPGAWPADQEFDAQQVAVDISAASLWAYRHGEPLAIADVRVRDGTLAMLRTPGHLTILPALGETSRAKAAALQASQAVAPGETATALVIEHISFERMAVDLYDATVPGGKPQRLRFEQVQGTVADLALPKLAKPILLDLQGILKGIERDGQVSLKGSVTPPAHDANLTIRLAGVDMSALQPYLLRLGERSVKHGRLDLAMDASVVNRQVHSPGQLTISGLEFGDAEGGTFAGVQRRAVLAALKRDGRVSPSAWARPWAPASRGSSRAWAAWSRACWAAAATSRRTDSASPRQRAPARAHPRQCAGASVPSSTRSASIASGDNSRPNAARTPISNRPAIATSSACSAQKSRCSIESM
jgi:hypothetical protein